MQPESPHRIENCPQQDRIVRIEEDVVNHKVWRAETTTLLSEIQVQLATLNERLKMKMENFDEHVKAGTAYRMLMVSVAITLALSIMGGMFAYGSLSNQVDTNTERWNTLIESGTVK